MQSAPGPANPGPWQIRARADVVVLDKVRAQPTSSTIKVGQSVTFGSLTIYLRRCVARPSDQAQDSAAFLDIIDGHSGGQSFHGWMLANEPGLTQLEHPLYGIQVVACR